MSLSGRRAPYTRPAVGAGVLRAHCPYAGGGSGGATGSGGTGGWCQGVGGDSRHGVGGTAGGIV
ncbi:hypothetical protein ACFHW1_26290 [Micromonospora sp. LOL_014]|uniref:hypothetical protein n=1 Tax=Micromonospora sp. LOL_014 TaxID=3345415 RepID=UPI003A87048C